MKWAMVFLSRRTNFSSAHRYFQPAFSEAENQRIFGRCYTPHGHGHNYVLEVTIAGQIDERTGMVMNLVDVDHILKEVTSRLDHQHLNHDVRYFSEKRASQGTVVPTTENIARYCWVEISARMPGNAKLHRVRLYEADDLWADFYG